MRNTYKDLKDDLAFNAMSPDSGHPTLQIPNSLGNKNSHWDSQNEALITHDEKKDRNHAKCFLFWENQVSLRINLL